MQNFSTGTDNLSLEEKRALLARVLREKARLSKTFPLSFAQERLWFLNQLEPDSPFYNVASAVRLSGPLDLAALERTLGEVVRRHEVLRTTFPLEGGRPVQRLSAPAPVSLPVVDLSALPAEEREREAAREAASEARQPFDLAAGPMLRAKILRLGDEEHVVMLTMHHIVSDGWSMNVLVREVSALYRAFGAGEESPLAELPIQYADYAVWQRGWLQGETLEAELDYWKRQLSGAPPLLELPTDRPRPAVQTFRGAIHSVSLTTELTQRLKELSRREGVTLFMTLLAAFDVLLSRYTGQSDITVGTDVANRNRSEVEGLIGFFVNQLVLRTDLSGDPSFRELLRRVREVCLGAYQHQDVPFEKLVEELNPERSLSHSPLFQVSFSLNTIAREALQSSDLKLGSISFKDESAKFDLALSMVEGGGRLGCVFEYNTDLFDQTTIQRMASHLVNLLEAVAGDPGRNVSELPMMSEEEERRLLVEFNETAADYPRDLCLHQLFETQAERTPDAEAVSFGPRRLTYAELDARANQLAHHLRSLGVGAESLVAVLLERSEQMVVAVLGVLKAGGAYVPLDPAYPLERLRFMLEDSGAGVLVTQESLSGLLDAAGVKAVCVDTDSAVISSHDSCAPSSAATPENLAYVIYTSGSTGRPKGSLVEHSALVNYALMTRSRLGLTPADRFLQFASFSFDVFVEEVFPALSAGARIVMCEAEEMMEVGGLTALIGREGVTACELPTAYWHEWVRTLAETGAAPPTSLRAVLVGGEKPSAERVAQWVQMGTPLVQVYGLTETAITSALFELTPGVHDGGGECTWRPGKELPIGRAVENTRLYVLDAWMRPAPVGVSGELYIGGDGLGRGYLNRPGLTAERFVPDPFGARPGERLYKTGDLVRYLPDGNVEFIGRCDEQVKVRGFRVELGEIEAALQTHEGVRECVAVTRESAQGDKRLVAYVVAEDGAGGLSTGELRAHLKGRLPEYMAPSAFVTLKELPLSPNGKIDKRALPEPVRAESEAEYVAAGTPVEEVLAGVWSHLLGVEMVGVNDNFFELGGHSLLATQLVSRVREAFGVEVPLRAVFESPTVAGLAESVEASMRAGSGAEQSPVVVASREEPPPLSFAQERLWFLDQLEPDSPFYNVASAVRLGGALDLHALERTVSELVRRHEVLRTTFPLEGGKPVQRISAHASLSLPVVDLSALPEGEREAEAAREAASEARQPFDLSAGPLLRAKVLRLDAEDHVVTLTMHHIVSDGWSMGILLREVSALYNAFSEGGESPLADLPVQYADYAVWQRGWLRGEVLERHLAYWRGQLSGAPPLLELPTDRPRPAVQTFRGAVHSFPLPAELTRRLKELSRREGVTLFMTLLAAFKVLLWRYTGQADISVGTDVAGRDRAETEGLIGFFVNQLVLRTRVEGEESFGALLRRVREVCLGAYQHQGMPFERLVEELNPERSLSHSPLFQVSFDMDYGRGEGLELGGLSAGGAGGGEARWSKYDLTLGVAEAGASAGVAFEYNTDLFDQTTIQRMASHLVTLLEAAAGEPGAAVSELRMMKEEEAQRLLVEFNETAGEYPRDLCAHQLFEGQAERTPDAVAVTFGEVVLTYRQLDERSNQLAHHLRALGVGPESLVGILLERSEQMIVSVLAVLKAGGAYVPLDPSYPQERLRFMLEDSAVVALVTQESLSSSLGESVRGVPRVVRVDSDSAHISSYPSSSPSTSATPENLAYAIYTSGSTGRPKGSLVSHSALVNYSIALRSYLGLSPSDRFLQFASFSFDVFVEEVFPALSAGARIVMGEAEEMMTAAGLTRLARREGVTVCELPTAFWHEWLNELEERGESAPESLRLVIIGGENALRERVQHWKRFGIPLMNAYGLTEVTVTSVVYTMPADTADDGWWEFPIGRPIMNTQAYVLDGRLRPVPVGVQGELYIGGDSLGRGYLNRPGLTAEKFIPDPFSTRPGARLYKTGDRVRYLPDGKIENLGRIDFQVKVRGFRVELGEIESVLSRHASVSECTVQARDGAGGKRLVAYVVCGEQEPPSVSELRAYLKERLPDYMTPSLFVFIDKVPLTPNGKVDRRALPEPEQARPELEAEFIAPRTHVEETLANIWAQLLGLDQIGVNDNFFELGGHSLLATQLISRVREAFGVEMPLRVVFESPTVAQLAASVGDSFEAEDNGADELSGILEALEGLSDEEARLLLEEKLGGGAADGDALSAAPK